MTIDTTLPGSDPLRYRKNLFDLKYKYFSYEKLRLTDDYQHESEEEEEKQTSKKELLKKPTEEDGNNFNEWVNKKETNINSEIFQRLFKFQRPSDMFKLLYKTNNKKKNKELVNMIKSGTIDSKNEINEDEKEAEKLDRILKIVDEIIDFNNKISVQSGEDLKILTPNQMPSRLPITLAQLKAGNNSDKLKNEIRQIFYSLYRSKKLTKQLYKSLIDII